jgi:hypothetical protein
MLLVYCLDQIQLFALPANIRQVWKGLPGTNTLAYYKNS